VTRHRRRRLRVRGGASRGKAELPFAAMTLATLGSPAFLNLRIRDRPYLTAGLALSCAHAHAVSRIQIRRRRRGLNTSFPKGRTRPPALYQVNAKPAVAVAEPAVVACGRHLVRSPLRRDARNSLTRMATAPRFGRPALPGRPLYNVRPESGQERTLHSLSNVGRPVPDAG
jgi:hypothetical protein